MERTIEEDQGRKKWQENRILVREGHVMGAKHLVYPENNDYSKAFIGSRQNSRKINACYGFNCQISQVIAKHKIKQQQNEEHFFIS